MHIQMFNGWYWFWLILSVGSVISLYFILRNKSQTTQKVVLFLILIVGLLAHFLKCLYPPYSINTARRMSDVWFINICGANIGLFPFLFISKSKVAKDFMFYLGILGGLVALLYPMEPMLKANQAAEWMDIIRFYFHHTMLFGVPLLMVIFKLHTLSYKRIMWQPVCLMGLFLFIMLNQVFASELGFVPLRGDEITEITYKNSSYIWGPDDGIGKILAIFCPEIFTYVPVGSSTGLVKYWPWFWLICPVFILLPPIVFGMCMIFDHKNFKNDFNAFKQRIKEYFNSKNDNLQPNQKENAQPIETICNNESNTEDILEITKTT